MTQQKAASKCSSRAPTRNGSANPAGDENVPGRVLLVSHHFGASGHTGGFRWHGMVRDLKERGWRFDVLTLTAEGASASSAAEKDWGEKVSLFPISDAWWGQRLRQVASAAMAYAKQRLLLARSSDSRFEDVDPDDVSVWQVGDRKPSLMRLKEAIVGATELLTEYIWTRRALHRACKLARRRDYRAVVVTSPAFLPQLVGAEVSRQFDVPYVADFRDPWYFGRGEDLALVDDAKRLAWRRCELDTIKEARVAVDISERAQRAVLDDLDGRIATPRYFIPNGYTARGGIQAPDSSCFRVAYTGWLWPFMDVRAVLKGCGRLKARHDLDPATFQVEFMGTDTHFGGVALDDLARAYNLADHFNHYPRASRSQANRLMEQAAVLVAFDSVCARGLCIPSKLYHYAQTHGALLLIGQPDGAMAEEAAKIKQRVYVPSDTQGINRALETAFERWKQNDFDEPIDEDGLFDARHSSAKMHRLLSSLRKPVVDRDAA